MDPYYFLDINFKLKDTYDVSFEPEEILDTYPDGSWAMNCRDMGHIFFQEKDYTEIFYMNEHKILVCKNNEGVDQYKIRIELIEME